MGILLKEPAIRIRIAVLVLLSIIAAVVYFNSLDNGFHFDDIHHLVNNIYIRNIKNVPLFFVDESTFSVYGAGHYRPLLLVSHSINYYFGRLNPVGYHVVNIALHVGTAFLVFLIMQAVLGSREQEAGSRLEVRSNPPFSPLNKGGLRGIFGGNSGFFAALAAGLIFLVHPFNSEAVNYISARSSIMSGFFYLLAFYCWVKFRQVAGSSKQVVGETKGGTLSSATCFYIASLLASLFGMLTKETVITLPIMLWLYDLYFAEKYWARRYLKQLVLYIPYIFIIVAPVVLLRLYYAGYMIIDEESSKPYYLHLLMETKVLVKYIYLLFFPIDLSVEHTILEVSSLLDLKVLGSILILLTVIGISLYLARNGKQEWRIISFFIFWFFIINLPTTLIPLSAPLQENRGYLASVGFATFLGIVINRFAWQSNYRRVLKSSALILILLLYSLLTYERNTIWKDDFALWLDAVQKSPTAWRAHYNLARSYEKSGLNDLAIDEYKKSAEIEKDSPSEMNRIGDIYLRNGKVDLALNAFEEAVIRKRTDFKSHMNLARLYLKLNQGDLASRECNIVLKLGELSKEENEYTAEARSCLNWLDQRKR